MPGKIVGWSYQGMIDDFGEHYTYGKRKKGGYHAWCKGLMNAGTAGRDDCPEGSFRLHSDGSSETKVIK